MHARGAVGLARPVVQLADLGEDLDIFAMAREGSRSELRQDRLDAEVIFAGGDDRYDRFLVGSISWAKEALAAFRVSFARRSSATSLRRGVDDG